jgi:hypothetical protein
MILISYKFIFKIKINYDKQNLIMNDHSKDITMQQIEALMLLIE